MYDLDKNKYKIKLSSKKNNKTDKYDSLTNRVSHTNNVNVRLLKSGNKNF